MKLEKLKTSILRKTGFQCMGRLMHVFTAVLLILIFTLSSSAQQLDVGIFESATPDKIEVKLRPDFNLAADQTITAILYTIRWNDPTIAITQVDYIFPFFVLQDGEPVTYNGYTYQVFACTPTVPIGTAVAPGEEILISSFTYTGGDCSFFELVDDEWTQANNGGPYFEVLGLDYTGIIYEPFVFFGPFGGEVTGGGNIYLGQSTGVMTLSGYYGTIVEWQRQFNTGAWTGIAGTAGLTEYSEIPGSAGTWRYRAALDEGSCPPVYSTEAEVIVSPATAWLGATGTSWFDAANWTSNEVPGPTTDVDIPAVSTGYYPVIQGFAQCRDLHVFDEASFTVSSTGSFTANGNVINSGGTDGLVILSGPQSNGSLILNNPGVEATVERYLEGWTSWPAGEQDFRGRQMISSLVQIQAIQPEFVSDPPLSTEEFIKWEEPLHQWISSSLGSTPPLQWNPAFEDYFTPGRGYRAAYASSDTRQFQGYLRAIDLEITGLTNTSGNNAPYAGWHMMGNPFTSTIDWNLGDWERVNLGACTLLWDSQMASYRAMPDGAMIPAGTGFMVYCLEEEEGSLTIPANARVHSSNKHLRRINENRIVLLASDAEETTSQEIILMADDNASGNYDPELDAVYFPGLAPSFYSRSDDNKPMMLNTLPDMGPGRIIPLGFEKNAFDSFTIELQESITNLPVYLLDLKTDSLHDLYQYPIYSFLSSDVDDPYRFRLQFETVGIGEQETAEASIYSHNGTLYLSNPHPGPARLEVYDLSGRRLSTLDLSGSGIRAFSLDLKQGLYLARLVTAQKEWKQKIFINSRY